MTTDDVKELARAAVLRGWHNPCIKHATVDAPRAESIAAEVAVVLQTESDRSTRAIADRNLIRCLLTEVGRATGDVAFQVERPDDENLSRLPEFVRDIASQGAERGPFDWGLMEILGHRAHRGRVSETQRFGVAGVLVEEPTHDGSFTQQFYPGGSVFAFTQKTEDEVRRWHVRYNAPPIQRLAIAEPADPQPEPGFGDLIAADVIPDDEGLTPEDHDDEPADLTGIELGGA
jgi:hypothetical protein